MKRPAISISHPSLSWSPERGERSDSGERTPVNKQGEAVQRYGEHGNYDGFLLLETREGLCNREANPQKEKEICRGWS